MIINLIIYTIYFYQKIESTQGFFFSPYVYKWNNPSLSIQVGMKCRKNIAYSSSLFTFDRNNVQFDSFRANTSKCLLKVKIFVTHPTRGIAMSNIVMRIFMMIYTNSHQTDVSISSMRKYFGVKIDVPDMVLCRFTLLCVVNLV